MYNEKVLDIFKNPINAGGLQGANGVGKAETQNSSDIVKLYFKIDDNQTITEAKFKTYGGVYTIVCSSVITELVIGKTIDDAININVEDFVEIMGEIPQEKEYSALLVLEAVVNTIQDYYKRKEKEEKKKQEN